MAAQTSRRARPARLPDLVLLYVVLILVALGLVMVYSASSVEAYVAFGSPWHYAVRQMLWAALGLALMAGVSRIPYRAWEKLAPWLYLATLGCLLLVLVPHIGVRVNGSRRWLGAGPLLFEPSELAKLAAVVTGAASLSRAAGGSAADPVGVGRCAARVAPLLLLVLLEPDVGTCATIAVIVAVMLYAAGARLRQLVGLGLLAALAFGLLALAKPYVIARLVAFLHPWQDPLGSGYHIIQGLYAVGSGGLFGRGLGGSVIKYLYLPEAQTDFIFAILVEELGFLGALGVLSLFVLLGWRGLRIALAAPDRFGTLLAIGITATVLVQAFVNIAVVSDLAPVTGVPLPLVSYGGSSLAMTLVDLGILLAISREARAGGSA